MAEVEQEQVEQEQHLKQEQQVAHEQHLKQEQQVEQEIQVEEILPEQIEALKGISINLNESSVDAYEAYMDNSKQQESIKKLLECLAG